MAQLFKGKGHCYYGSIPMLPIVLESYVICVSKSIGYADVDNKWVKHVGQVVCIISPKDVISPKDEACPWWEVQKADKYTAPQPLDTVIIVEVPDVGNEMFLPKDLVHITPVFPN